MGAWLSTTSGGGDNVNIPMVDVMKVHNLSPTTILAFEYACSVVTG